MNKVFQAAAFTAVLLMSHAVFAAAPAAVPADPCTCCFCTAASQAMPAQMPVPCGYPAAPPRVLGSKLFALLEACPLTRILSPCPLYPCAEPIACAAPVPCAEPVVCAEPAPAAVPPFACGYPCASPCTYPAVGRLAARRAARLAAFYPAAPFYESAPAAAGPALPPVPTQPVPAIAPEVTPATAAPVPAAMPYANPYAMQRRPLLNFMSSVRTARPAYPAEYSPYAAGQPGFYQVPMN